MSRTLPVWTCIAASLLLAACHSTPEPSAFYYTQTHRNDHPEHAFYRGFNIAGRRVFSDYRLIVAGAALDPQTATVIVRPDALIRTYPQGITETLRLFDGQDVVEVEVSGANADVTLQLSGDTVAAAHPSMRQSRSP